MTLSEITPRPAPVHLPSSQATAVEQSRAVAEVQAAVLVAKSCPRNLAEAVTEMRESCAQIALAERAFYRYPRGRETVTGPTIHLARELARCFGNVQYGISELRRDQDAGESEMVAFAWDVERNTRSAQTFIVPHIRDTKNGPVKLTDLRDVYENNANNGARRVREAIFAILPTWFTEEAKTLCAQTIEKGESDTPLAQRVATIITSYRGNGVTQEQLEQKVGRKASDWTPQDVVQLRVIWQSLGRGEVTIEEEFAPARVTAAEITSRSVTPAPTDSSVGSAPVLPAEDQPSSAGNAGAAPAEEAPGDGEPTCPGCGRTPVCDPSACPGAIEVDATQGGNAV